MPPHLDFAHTKSCNLSVPGLYLFNNGSTHSPFKTAVPSLSVDGFYSGTGQASAQATATEKCVHVASVGRMSSTGVTTTTIASNFTTTIHLVTTTSPTTTSRDDSANTGPLTSLSPVEASGVTAASMILFAMMVAACIFFVKRRSRARLGLVTGSNNGTSSEPSPRQSTRLEQVPRSDLEVVRHSNSHLHRENTETPRRDEKAPLRARRAHLSDAPEADGRLQCPWDSQVSVREDESECQSNLEATNTTDEVESLPDDALRICEARHPVAVSSVDDRVPGLICSRFSSSSSDVEEVLETDWRRATMPSRPGRNRQNAPRREARHSIV